MKKGTLTTMAKGSCHYGSKSVVNSLQNVKNVARASVVDKKNVNLEFVKGGFSKSEAWFIKTLGGDEFVVLPEGVLASLLNSINTQHEEKIKISLQRDISNLIPIDFDDAMAVGLSELEKLRSVDGYLPQVNTAAVASKIKSDYPNLFFNVNGYLKK